MNLGEPRLESGHELADVLALRRSQLEFVGHYRPIDCQQVLEARFRRFFR